MIFLDIFFNNYSKIYILTPKNFYFYLPFFFRNTKFYAIVYDNKNNIRPPKFLRNYLYKYKVVYRNKINEKSYRELQSDLLDDNILLDIKNNGLNIPKINVNLKLLLPEKFVFFQFRYLFFEKLGCLKKADNFELLELP